MSTISNIAILQNPQAKKSFSKISFEPGEKFNARIVSTDSQKGEVNLKLLDGWQFSAKLDKPLEQGTSGSVLKFEVEGFEDDKLKIRLVYEDKEGKATTNDVIGDFTKGKGLNGEKAEALLFEKMIKHDMPLTKDNIVDIKNLVDFREKISLNSSKEEIFIAKYLNSRDIDPQSEKAIEITKTLKDFFQALKNLNVDEILLFKENNIELTKENLESFTKLFKGKSAVYNNLKDISNFLLNSDTTKNMQKNPIGKEENSVTSVDESIEGFKNVELKNNNLKQVANLINKELKDLDVNYRVLNSTIKSLVLDKSLGLNNSVGLDKSLVLDEGLGLGKSLDFDKSLELGKSLNLDEDVQPNKNLELDKNLQPDKNLQLDRNLAIDKNLKPENNSIDSSTIKALVDKIFKADGISLNPDSYIKLIENLESKLNTKQTEPSNLNLEDIEQNEELPLNILQKDKVTQVEIDSKSSINTKVNAYGKNNSLNEIINMIKKELNISEVDKEIINNVEVDIEKITTDSLIKEQIKLKTDEIKSIIKDVIENKLNLKPETYEKVMNLFHEKLNDFKMFNSISEQYYYLDLPINVKEDEYQLKLIIKDDRKKNKKIDSKNVKIATSVKTINMGTMDAYIKINSNNMNIDINCDKSWVKVLELGKQKLIMDLSNLNYRVSIDVNKKAKEFTLSNCGEFFDDRSFNAINIKV